MTGIVVLAAASDPRPDDNNVVAGWVGFVVVLALIVAVVFILRSFTKQLKKVDAARDAGLYGDDDGDDGDETHDSDQSHGSGTPPTHRQH